MAPADKGVIIRLVKKSSENWLKIAEADLRMAKVLLKAYEALGLIFHLHAAVEKILKGIATEKGIVPPKIHNLKKLAINTCEIKLENYRDQLLYSLDQAFIDTRYPDDIDEIERKYPIEYCEKLYKEVEVTFKWLKNLLLEN